MNFLSEEQGQEHKGPTWLLGSEGELLLTDEGIDEGGLADVGPAEDGELGAVILGAVARPGAAFHELHLLDLRVTSVGPDHDVGTR